MDAVLVNVIPRASVEARALHWWTALTTAHDTDVGPVPAVRFSKRMRTTAGTACNRTHTVRFSTRILHRVGMEAFDVTIAHEVAHIYCDRLHSTRCGHDRRWKSVMQRIGLPSHRCHNYSVERQPRRTNRTARLLSRLRAFLRFPIA
ncbi:MAG: SprT-like domain-containing protein [Planctomycetota bacterium]|nr:SprT-like domain-containing protein [Planctomycetota bacterium]